VSFIAAGNLAWIREKNLNEEKKMEKPDLSGVKILFILPPYDFCDEEYQKPKDLFADWGARVFVASSSLANAKGMSGAVAKPNICIKEAQPRNFETLLLVGGIGSQKFWHDQTVHNLMIRANRLEKIVSASGYAVMILANAGLLRGKRATGCPVIENFLKWQGAIYTGHPVEIVGNIVTASGPEAAEKFAEAIAELLASTTQ
jgi:protease I